MLDVHRLMLLREVHLRGSISAAAQALSYSPSAVSQHLGQLEKEAGLPLLEKAGRGIRLTSAAEELTRHTDDILTILERAESDLAASHTSARGTIRLAAFTTISRQIVPHVLVSLRQQHPGLDVRYQQVEPETGLQMLSSRRIDILVADSYPDTSETRRPDLHAEVLTEDPIRAYLPAGAGEPESVRWVLEPSGTEARAWTQRLCRRSGFEPNVAYESADLMFHLRIVQAGLAAAFLPDLLLREADAELTPTALLDTHRQSRRISLLCKAGAERRPSVAACRDAFVAHLA